MRKNLLVILSVFVVGCGNPTIDTLDPNSGPPHTIVKINGNSLGTSILWKADQATPTILPGALFGGGYFSVPVEQPGIFQVALKRDGKTSNLVPFTVTSGVFPGPVVTHISSMFIDPVGADSVRFYLFVQGPNIDIGAKIKINNDETSSSLWRALLYNSEGHQPSTLKFPIFHYAMIFTTITAKVGTTLNVSVKNIDQISSNVLAFTIPSQADWDSDGDGLKDSWEENGLDDNNDGTIDCDLPKMGAHKFVYDLFVEADFMDGKDNTPDKIPAANSWTIVEEAYKNSPLINLFFGAQGIQLHVDHGQNSYTDLQGQVFIIPASEIKGGQILPFSDFIRMDASASGEALAGETTVNFYTLKGTNFSSSRKKIFHYCIFANKHGHSPGSTGRGETFGNDLFITLSNNRLLSANNSAGTFMHELGHNINLKHGGNDDIANKPNHKSVMSYFSFAAGKAYQFEGVDINCDRIPDQVYDYSHGMLKDLDENALIENAGLCDGTDIDWNANGIIDPAPVIFNIDGGGDTLLKDHNNWGSIRLDFINSTEFAD